MNSVQTAAHRFTTLGVYFKSVFGCRVHKITVDAGLTCPNRDGTLSSDGCLYCNAKGSGTGAHAKNISITRQLETGKKKLGKRYHAKKFLAYFQSYTNTYADVDHLKRLYDEALAVPDIVGLCIGTRPDCVNTGILDLLQDYAVTKHIWIEYGLQSVHDRTLHRINRGHDFAAFTNAVYATADRGIQICTHIILGLPGETASDMRYTARTLGSLPINGVKLHLLYVIAGTRLAQLYRRGEYQCLTQAAYARIVCDVLARLPAHVVIQRLTSDPHPEELIAPQWALEKQQTRALILDRLNKKNIRQGDAVAFLP